jgi:hypothetical protein
MFKNICIFKNKRSENYLSQVRSLEGSFGIIDGNNTLQIVEMLLIDVLF